jgi:hypothetical protein
MRVQRHTHRIRELIGLGPTPAAGQVPVSDGNQGATWGSPSAVAWGEVGYAERTTDITGIGTSDTDLTDLSVTFTAVTGRRYRTACQVLAFLAAGDRTNLTLNLKESTTILGTAQGPISGSYWSTYRVEAETEPSAGAHTYKATAAVAGGASGTATVEADVSTGPYRVAWLRVEDIGPV